MEQTLKWVPATKKIWLYLLAGIMWSGVGVMLVVFASSWLGLFHSWMVLPMVLAGVLLALVIYFFGFSKLASNIVQRIIKIPRERVCLFAFQKWTSYPLVLVMVAMEIYLRNYSPIPKPYLAVLYIGLGARLFASSIQYNIQGFRTARN